MRFSRLVLTVVAVVGFAAGGLLFSTAGANTGTVVINEIFYNQPDTGNFGEDFIELHNPGTTAIDLTGYTFDDEGSAANNETVSLSGTLAPGGYAYITRSGYDATAFWGTAPLATMEFGLSGGGETLTIRDNTGTIIDEVDYDDRAPWPGEPDGDGPSLELINPLADNALPNAWAASTGTPTPGVVNSVFATNLPEPITNVVATPFEPNVNQPITVVAQAPGATAPQLIYVIDFGPEITVTMNDNGVSPDVTAGDGVFTATIPGQAAGELVRYRILAPATGEEFPVGDARRYEGVVVNDPNEIPTTMTNMEWFIPETDYNTMFDDPEQRDIYAFGSVLAIDGVVYDNMTVKIRGGDFARRTYDKQGLSFDMPGGVDLDRPDLVPHPIDEFALSAERGFFYGRPASAWQVFEDAGFPPVPGQHVRVQRNGDFYGVFRFGEKLDGTWRDQHGIDGGFYKAEGSGFFANAQDFDKKQPDDGDLGPIAALADVLRDAPSQAKTDELYESVDLANAVNYTAVAWIVGHVDSQNHNFYMHEDTEDTGLWQIYPWDLSNTFGVSGGGCDATIQSESATLDCVNNPFYISMREIPGFEDMVWRRIRTLIDGPVANGVLEGLFQQYHPTVSSAEQSADRAMWPLGVPANYRTPAQIDTEIDRRRDWLTNDASYPSAQAGAPGIVINELTYDPANGVEFLELLNPTNNYVDLSGWTISGNDFVAPDGLVIAPNGFVVLTESIPDLFAAYPNLPNVVVAEYDGGLSSTGELLELRTATGALIDSVNYADSAPWPAEPAAGQVSLSLDDPQTNNSLAANWGISQATGGTPGEENDTVNGTAVTPPAVVINEIHYHPDGTATEFIELLNAEPSPVDVSGWDLDGLITFPNPTVIPAGGLLVVTENLANFQATYPGVAAIAWTSGGLDNGGERISLDNELGVQIDVVDYDDVAPWPTAADGNGPSLELLDSSLDNTLPGSWFASNTPGGSPGFATIPPPMCNGLPVTVFLAAGDSPTAGDDVILGTNGADVIVASSGDDTICALAGDDTINAGPGDDWVNAGIDDDTIFGQDGEDTILGGAGNDLIVSGNDNDTVDGGSGDDTMNGGSGDDTIYGRGGDDTIFGQGGADTIHGHNGVDSINGLDGADNINGGPGNDVINAGQGNDLVNGNGDDDTIFGLTGNDTLNGNFGDDQIFGQAGADTITGGSGNDTIFGNQSNDIISDSDGTNTINGGPGDDQITGGSGADTIFGDGDLIQAGNDTIDGGPGGPDQILGFAGDDDITSTNGVADTVNAGPHATGDSCTVDASDTVFNCE